MTPQKCHPGQQFEDKLKYLILKIILSYLILHFRDKYPIDVSHLSEFSLSSAALGMYLYGGRLMMEKREGGKAAVCTPEAVRHEREISNAGR